MLFWNNSLTPPPPPLFQLTSTATDPSLGFTIVSCFVSPNSDPSMASDYTLIETVCPKDDSVTLHPQRDFPAGGGGGGRKTFSFTFNSKFNKSLLFLHCEMSLCSTRSHGSPGFPPVCRRFYSSLGFFFSFLHPPRPAPSSPPFPEQAVSRHLLEQARHVSLVFVREAAAIWILADPEPARRKAPSAWQKNPL